MVNAPVEISGRKSAGSTPHYASQKLNASLCFNCCFLRFSQCIEENAIKKARPKAGQLQRV
jgi:hypothetical protein